VLEAEWLLERGADKTILHGLIQIAAAFYHQQRSNLRGARSLLQKGIKKLEPWRASWRGIDLLSLKRQLLPWQEFLNGAESERRLGSPPNPPLPRIERATYPK